MTRQVLQPQVAFVFPLQLHPVPEQLSWLHPCAPQTHEPLQVLASVCAIASEVKRVIDSVKAINANPTEQRMLEVMDNSFFFITFSFCLRDK